MKIRSQMFKSAMAVEKKPRPALFTTNTNPDEA